jgi:hypothetical protein
MLTALIMIAFFGGLSAIVNLHDRMHTSAPPSRRTHPAAAAGQIKQAHQVARAGP